MKINGERTLVAPVDAAWKSLFDPAILRQCIPGCEAVVQESAILYKVTLVTAIGPLRARFSGTLEMMDVQAPTTCKLSFEGAGGAIGFAKGTAVVLLSPCEGGTRLHFSADTQIGGKLAQVGSRLIDSVAKKLSAEFFDKFEVVMAAQPGATAAGDVELDSGVRSAGSA